MHSADPAFIADTTARMLLEVKAVLFSEDKPFIFTSGCATAGIPYAAWIADRFGLPMQYIRKKPKGFGRNAQIEGDVRAGARTLLVEDLTTDGRSKINFCKALREAGAIVEHVFVNFYYDIFPESKKTLADL